MSSSKEIGVGASLDWLKWGLVAIIVALAVYANWYYQEQSLFLRVLGLLIAGAAAFLIAVKTEKGNAAWNLIKEARSEIRRVVWPTNNETTQTTLVYLIPVLNLKTMMKELSLETHQPPLSSLQKMMLL